MKGSIQVLAGGCVRAVAGSEVSKLFARRLAHKEMSPISPLNLGTCWRS